MSLERWIRLIAGTFIIVSVALSYFHSRLYGSRCLSASISSSRPSRAGASWKTFYGSWASARSARIRLAPSIRRRPVLPADVPE